MHVLKVTSKDTPNQLSAVACGLYNVSATQHGRTLQNYYIFAVFADMVSVYFTNDVNPFKPEANLNHI
jgi:hypothetical protein